MLFTETAAMICEALGDEEIKLLAAGVALILLGELLSLQQLLSGFTGIFLLQEDSQVLIEEEQV